MAGDTRKWWAPIAACPTCNEDADLCPHDQEHAMTHPIQRRHDEIIGRLDALIDAVTPGDKQTEPVTDPNVSVHLLEILRYAGDEWGPLGVALAAAGLTDKDALIHRLGNPVDTAPDVDPDEALAEAIADADPHDAYGWDRLNERGRAMYRVMARAAREHIEQEIPEELDKIGITWQSRARRMGKRAEEAETDVERLTRERDVAEARCERLSVLAEKGERYEALRAAIQTDPSVLRLAASDIEAQGTGWWKLPRSLPATLRGIADALTRDRQRGRDE